MMRTRYGLPLLLIVCILIGILCFIVGACITRNAAEAATKQECTMISVSDVGGYSTTQIMCPEKSYRCFMYTANSYSTSISCVPTSR